MATSPLEIDADAARQNREILNRADFSRGEIGVDLPGGENARADLLGGASMTEFSLR